LRCRTAPARAGQGAPAPHASPPPDAAHGRQSSTLAAPACRTLPAPPARPGTSPAPARVHRSHRDLHRKPTAGAEPSPPVQAADALRCWRETGPAALADRAARRAVVAAPDNPAGRSHLPGLAYRRVPAAAPPRPTSAPL